jgi:hypothetical protein
LSEDDGVMHPDRSDAVGQPPIDRAPVLDPRLGLVVETGGDVLEAPPIIMRGELRPSTVLIHLEGELDPLLLGCPTIDQLFHQGAGHHRDIVEVGAGRTTTRGEPGGVSHHKADAAFGVDVEREARILIHEEPPRTIIIAWGRTGFVPPILVTLGNEVKLEEPDIETTLDQLLPEFLELFILGCEALSIEWTSQSLTEPTGDKLEEFWEELVKGGLNVGLFELYFVAKGNKDGWNEARPTPGNDDRPRRFFVDEDSGLALDIYAKGGVCLVVGNPTWFTSRGGSPCANLDNVTVVPSTLVKELVDSRAAQEKWIKLSFQVDEDSGRPELASHDDGRGLKYVPSRLDNKPEAGIEYWCSVDRRLTYSVRSVWVHYPVVL